MERSIIKRAAKFLLEHRRRKRRYKIVTGLAMVIVFITVYLLILPAVTAERNAVCGMEEHTHDADCFDDDGAVVCDIPEHIHTESCFESEEEEKTAYSISSFPDDEAMMSEYYYDGDVESRTLYGNSAAEKSESSRNDEYYVPEDFSADNAASDETDILSVDENDTDTVSESENDYYNIEVFPDDENVSGAAGVPSDWADDHDNGISEDNNTLSDNVTSGGGIDVNINVETHSEEYAEEYTEATTELIMNDPDMEIKLLKAENIPLCGLPEHKHSELCYNEAGMLICDTKEHKHDNSCYSIMLMSLDDTENRLILHEGDGYKITLNSNGSYTLTFDGSEIPDGFISYSDLSSYADNISKIIIKNNVAKIGSDAFVGMKNLTAVEVYENESLTVIGNRAFKDCKKLKTINLENFKNLESIGLPSSETTGGEVFENTGLREITIPPVKTIGERAFKGCSDLVNVRFEKGRGQTRNVYGGAFADCTSLESINFEDFMSDTGDSIALGYNSVENEGIFSNCTSLKSIKFPPNTEGDVSYMFFGCSTLESIEFGSNTKLNTIKGKYFIKGSKINELDLSGFSIRNIPEYFLAESESLNSVILPADANIIYKYAFADCPNLKSVVPDGGVSNISEIDEGAFKNDRSFTGFEGVTGYDKINIIDPSAFENCTSLEDVYISPRLTSLGSDAFKDNVGLENLTVYFPNNLINTSVKAGSFSGTGRYRLSFADYEKVYTEPNCIFYNRPYSWNIYKENLAALLPNAKDFVFEPDMYFTLGSDNETLGLSRPFDRGGTYFTDSQGNLYRKTSETTAEFIYAARNETDITIPSEVSYESRELINTPRHVERTKSANLTVTAIGRDAFKGSGIKSVTIESPKNITEVEPYAFANSTSLGSINGENTVTAVEELFSKTVKTGDNAFYNTALTADAEQQKEKLFENPDAYADNSGSIVIKGGDHDASNVLSLALSKENQIEGKDGKYLTGNAAKINVSVSNVNDNAYYRVYIRREAGCEISISTVEGYDPFVLHETDDPDIFYYEFQAKDTGDTLNPIIGITYPNYNPPGSRAQIWGAKVSGEHKDDYEGKVIEPGTNGADAKSSNQYLDPEWLTQPKEFALSKTILDADNLGFTASADGKNSVLEGLRYTIDYKYADGEEGSGINLGSDIVKYVEFADKLTLPEGIAWRKLNADNTRFEPISGGGNLYAYDSDGKEYLVFSLNNFGQLSDMSLQDNGDGSYTLHWRLMNTSTVSEIQSLSGILTFGDEVLTAGGLAEKAVFDNIHNDITSDTYYTFSDNKQAKASADTSVGTGEGRIKLNKRLINPADYMGEDVSYELSIDNPSAFGYTKLDRLEDDLSSDTTRIQYIKPENMQKLFDSADGEYLTITISNAILTAPLSGKTAVAVDGYDTVELSPSDTGASEVGGMYDDLVEFRPYWGETQARVDTNLISEDAEITLKKAESGIAVKAVYTDKTDRSRQTKDLTVGSGGFGDIKSALDSLAYIVTNPDCYKLSWDYPEGFELKAGETIKYEINATVKNSLMYLPEGDHLYYLGWVNSPPVPYSNTATAYSTESEVIGTANTIDDNTEARFDLNINKRGFVDGIDINKEDDNGNRYMLKFGDVIDYEASIRHYGSSSYDVLPVVDCMSGPQVLLAAVKENEKADWAEGATIYEDNGVEYYVLNKEKTYEGVYLNGYYADSVTVSTSESGLKTLIKYYIKDTIDDDCSYVFKYKAILSPEYAGAVINGGFSIDNKVWANDYATHRIEAPLFTNGSRLNFDKKIITEKSVSPDFDEVDRDDYTTIKQDGNTVTYRLMLENIYDSGSAVITGADMYDMLPKTGGVFTWEMDNNLTVDSYMKTTDDVKITLNNIDFTGHGGECKLVNDDPSTTEVENDKGQQYIVWDEGFKAELPAKTKLYIYITLKFPSESETWNKYTDAIKDNPTLFNTFYVYSMPDTVRHSLANPAKVLLQKGVYEVGHYTVSDDQWANLNSYYMDSDRYHYNNNDTEAERNRIKNVVTYYVIVKNSGTSRVYLSNIYDILPEGYEFLGLKIVAEKNNNSTWYHVGEASGINNKNTLEAGTMFNWSTHNNLLARPQEYNKNETWGKDSSYQGCKIVFDAEAETTLPDGRKRLKFNIADNNEEVFRSLNKNQDGVYYLDAGEWLQFGYTVSTGNADIDTAINSVAMEIIDPENTNMPVEVDKDSKIAVNDANGKQPNDGSRELWDDETAATEGFDEYWNNNENTDRQWLVSQVTLTKGEHVPGITKTVTSPIVEAGDPVEWTVNAHNNGTGELKGYTVEDTVDAPFRFSGDVFYSVFAPVKALAKDDIDADVQSRGSRRNGGDEVLFTIKRDSDPDTLHIVSNRMRADSNGTELKIGGAPVKISVDSLDVASDTYYTSDINVSIDRDKDTGSEILRVYFPDSSWSIPAGGHGELKLTTENTDTAGEKAGTFLNNASLLPDDKSYDSGSVTQGENITGNMGVKNAALVNLYKGAPTGAVKLIEEVDNPSNKARSDTPEDNFIYLADKTKEFRYTLQVQNMSEDPMTELVFMDNLPQIGDSNTVRAELKRKSEFEVSLSDDPEFKVKVGENILTPEQYTITYSDKNGGYTDADWDGTAGDWYNVKRDSTRSFRLAIKDDGSGSIIPGEAVIQVSFNAKITGDAKPSQIAWNSFAYSYETKGLKATAAPLNVGVRIPSAPQLKKTIVNSKCSLSPANREEDETFHFVLYRTGTGNPLTFSDGYSYEAVAATFGSSWQEFPPTAAKGCYTYITLTVPKGTAQSEILSLADGSFNEYKAENLIWDSEYKNDTFVEQPDKKWQWEQGATYHIVEIDDSDYYSYGGVNGYEQREWSFVYNINTNEEITFANEKPQWSILARKADSEDNSPLAGAVFGLYSPNESDQMTAADMEALGIDYTQFGQLLHEGSTYYLSYVLETPDSGVARFNELCEEAYVLLEIKAPDGYYGSTEPVLIKRDSTAVATVTVENTKGAPLPGTGGYGLGSTIKLIALLLLSISASGFAAIYIRKKR